MGRTGAARPGPPVAATDREISGPALPERHLAPTLPPGTGDDQARPHHTDGYQRATIADEGGRRRQRTPRPTSAARAAPTPTSDDHGAAWALLNAKPAL